MNKKSNEVVEEMVEELESSNGIQQKKKNKTNVIITIVVLCVLIIACCGVVLVDHLTAKEDVIGKEDVIEKEKNEVVNEDISEKEENKEDNDEVSEGEGTNCTTQDEEITITEDMKKELNNIANIRDGYCYVEKVFYNMNGYMKDLTLENKKYIIMNYYVVNNSVYDKISEASFNEIAAKFSISDSFDTVMTGFEKVGNEYIIPPMGCESPERVIHDLTYQDTGNTITVIDNVKIVNDETQDSRSIKVIYTFVYSKKGENITFRLEKVNSENQ